MLIVPTISLLLQTQFPSNKFSIEKIGRKLIPAVNEIIKPGIYSVNLNTSEVTGLIYFLQSKPCKYIQIKKIL